MNSNSTTSIEGTIRSKHSTNKSHARRQPVPVRPPAFRPLQRRAGGCIFGIRTSQSGIGASLGRHKQEREWTSKPGIAQAPVDNRLLSIFAREKFFLAHPSSLAYDGDGDVEEEDALLDSEGEAEAEGDGEAEGDLDIDVENVRAVNGSSSSVSSLTRSQDFSFKKDNALFGGSQKLFELVICLSQALSTSSQVSSGHPLPLAPVFVYSS
ncbi:hypothetical protein DFH11DRAFT_1728666 [Phellopilus nigrolimitatus]|nr:hypothetical protein DFH11DRAFT_1728666 [Phellopilus nigrolimitatus]